MAAKKPARRTARGTAPGASTPRETPDGFSAEERAAIRDRARELKSAARRRKGGEDEENAVLAAIAAMAAPDRALGERLLAIVRASAPGLTARLWYGMPAWARDGKVVCFFQAAQKFKTRYATLGFSDEAALDDGTMWPTAFALRELTAEDEAKIGALVARAVR